MSRDPGMWQRGILAAFEKYPAVYLMDLLPKPRIRSQVVAINRAARQLERTYKIKIHRWMCSFTGGGFVAVARLGYQIRDRKDVSRISVARGREEPQCNT